MILYYRRSGLLSNIRQQQIEKRYMKKDKKLWFQEEPHASRIAQYNDLYSRNQGLWRIFRDVDGYNGMMISDGAVWEFGCQSCPEMITGGPILPEVFLSQHVTKCNEVKSTGSGFVSWDEAIGLVCQRLTSLGFGMKNNKNNTASE